MGTFDSIDRLGDSRFETERTLYETQVVVYRFGDTDN
jgi:hypothetical protein